MLTSCDSVAALIQDSFAQFRSVIVRVLCPTCSEYSQFEAIDVPARGRLIICQSCDLVWTVRPADVLEDLPSEAQDNPASSEDTPPPALRSRKLMAAATGSIALVGIAASTAAYFWLGSPPEAAVADTAKPRLSIVNSDVDRDTTNKLLTVDVRVRNEGTGPAKSYDLCVRLMNKRSEPLFRWCERVVDRPLPPGEQSSVRLQIVSPPSEVASAEVQVN